MYASGVFVRSVTACFAVAALGSLARAAAAQTPSNRHEQHQPPAMPRDGEEPQHEHMQHEGTDMTMFPPRDGSGTAWLPDTTPMYGIHGQAGAWQWMGHGNAFVQSLHESGDRGTDQFGSINWIMGMARRNIAGGRVGLRAMFSLEPWSIPGCGYPDLLASGEVCDRMPIHDSQHPHDLFMELAAEYDRPIRGSLRWQAYGGLAGEPALGPVAYPHRVSATPNPLAPISHHWLDATHITFGVVTGGIYDTRWKAEASMFNGREPDDKRANIDFGSLNSFSGRLWFLPTSTLALQISAGHLSEAEPTFTGGPGVDVDRITASATYHRSLAPDSLWASTLAWGRNVEEGESTSALLVESNLILNERHTWFGRFEVGNKSAHDLDVHGTDEVFTVAKFQAGYTRYLAARRGLKVGFGGTVSAGIVPSDLKPVYGSRMNLGWGVFVTLRPATHRM
jgi:hypothetical protein